MAWRLAFGAREDVRAVRGGAVDDRRARAFMFLQHVRARACVRARGQRY
jgi:hypothetical protein